MAVEQLANFDFYSPNPSINETVRWLLELGLPPLPIAPWHCHTRGVYFNNAQPGQPIEPKFTGKNPSFLTSRGRPILVSHTKYQSQMPDRDVLKRWFAHPNTGVATMGGWRNVVWVDVDAKQFESVEVCQSTVNRWIERHGLQGTYVERTHRGGYHVALRVPCAEAVTFMQFRFAKVEGASGNRAMAGEVLSSKYPIVLAPTVGTQGRYRCLNRAVPMRVESLEQVGVLPLRTLSEVQSCENSSKQSWFRTQIKEVKTAANKRSSRSPLLHKLLRRSVVEQIFSCHLAEPGERSDLLVTVAREAIGWQNWLRNNGYPFPMPDAITFIFQIGEQIGLDCDRIERVLNSASNGVPIVQSMPGVWLYRGDAGCQEKLRSVWR